jgi:hypothetical protein
VTDAANGEECDDGNGTGGDGCEPETCHFSCHDDADCPDADPCDGDEVCGETSHACEPGPLPEDGAVGCTLEGGDPGQCRMGLCAHIDCGNGMVGAGEECDDDSPGCAGDCQWVCESDAECDDQDPCTGTETCDVAAHTCIAGTALDCDDGDDCSADDCTVGVGCEHAQADGDGDHFALGTCAPDSLYQGGDCDDAVATTYPGAPELCNDADDDCNDKVDDGIVFINWYPDSDGDGYPANTGALSACRDPNDDDGGLVLDYIQPPLDGMGTAQFDCADTLAAAHPNASFNSIFHCVSGSTRMQRICTTTFQSQCIGWGCAAGFTSTYDWDCSGIGSITKQYTATSTGCGCSGNSGWANGVVPACGGSDTYRSCGFACCVGGFDVSIPKAGCGTLSTRSQGCR